MTSTLLQFSLGSDRALFDRVAKAAQTWAQTNTPTQSTLIYSHWESCMIFINETSSDGTARINLVKLADFAKQIFKRQGTKPDAVFTVHRTLWRSAACTTVVQLDDTSSLGFVVEIMSWSARHDVPDIEQMLRAGGAEQKDISFPQLLGWK